MFFGLTNSPAIFQTMMDNVFDELISKGVIVVYLDDILIFMETLKEHRKVTWCCQECMFSWVSLDFSFFALFPVFIGECDLITNNPKVGIMCASPSSRRPDERLPKYNQLSWLWPKYR